MMCPRYLDVFKYFIKQSKASDLMTIANRKGESGHPCLVPLSSH